MVIGQIARIRLGGWFREVKFLGSVFDLFDVCVVFGARSFALGCWLFVRTFRTVSLMNRRFSIRKRRLQHLNGAGYLVAYPAALL
jgi:hypothetical protein